MRYLPDLGFGMFGWADEDIAIVGGIRCGGYQRNGQLRCSFSLYDTEHKVSTGEYKPIGKLELVVGLPEEENEPNVIKELVLLEIDKSLRGQGYGRRVVEAVLRAAPDDIRVCDIKKTKQSFWKKMGVENFTTRGGDLSGVLVKQPEVANSFSATTSPSM